MLTSILAALVALGTTGMAQDYPDEYLGLPGDNLNLYAVMKLFQESETLEGFERNLNDEKTKINNLDLNGDNLIDYITVTDYPDGNDHTIVLRVSLGRKDFQDVAVFTVQKFNNGTVQIQLIGDESLYGKNYIIEPIYEETPNPGYMGRPENRTYVTVVRTTPYEIAYWPLIRYIYMPGYAVWRSSWYWGYYPEWWNPWRPYYWHYYYGYHYNWYTHYYSHYHHWDYCRWNRYNDFYYHGVRAYSPVVQVNITKNVYRNTYLRPEQRKEGEALYTRLHPDRETRVMANRTESTNGRPASAGARSAERASTSGRTQVSKSATTQRPATATRQPVTSERSQVSKSAGEERSSAATRPSVQTQRTTTNAPERSSVQTQRTPSNAPERSSVQAQRSSTTASPSKSQVQTRSNSSSAPSRSSVQTQRSSSAPAARSSAPAQRSSGSTASRSSAPAQRSPAASSSRSSAPSQRSSGSSSQGRSSSSSSSSSRSGSNDSKSGRR